MFTSPFSQEVTVPTDCKVVWVQDLFAQQYAGGAELTSQALIDSCAERVFCIPSSRVTMRTLESGVDRLWVFGNFSQLSTSLVPAIVANLKYVVLEYDYKFCSFRSVELHAESGAACDCHQKEIGKMVSAFMFGAQHLFWMSKAQRERYHHRFPFLSQRPNTVLSSVFSPSSLAEMDDLRSSAKDRNGWLVLGSKSWIKGAEDAEEWCRTNGKEYEVVWNLPYSELLKRLAKAEGFVYLPKGGDTCPRMVIEAKLLGCDLHINDDVQHACEEWFSEGDPASIESYLGERPHIFWETVRHSIPGNQRVSGYTTTYNCIEGEYPFRECIVSMLGFCDEVVVVDGGSSDGTLEAIREMQSRDPRIVLHVQERDWNDKRHAVFDGKQKALARAICTGDFLWQQDVDEIVHERDYQRIRELVSSFPASVDLIALPVMEYWGPNGKVRVDVNFWKWRLSRNVPHVTHGIPASLRRFDEDGRLYSAPGSDTCDYIRSDSFQPVPFATFMSEDAERARQASLMGDKNALSIYEQWVRSVVGGLPTVRHYSWWNMPRKIRAYRRFWSKFWASMYGGSSSDTAEANVFFDRPWSEITDADISRLADEIVDKTGGWIFHKKIDLTVATPHITVPDSHPVVVQEWIKEVK